MLVFKVATLCAWGEGTVVVMVVCGDGCVGVGGGGVCLGVWVGRGVNFGQVAQLIS